MSGEGRSEAAWRASCGRRWTRDEIVAAIRRFEARYGRQPCQADFTPADARRKGHGWRAERYYRDDDYPSVLTVRARFGSWSAGLEAAGFEPRGRGCATTARVGTHLAAELDVPEAQLELAWERAQERKRRRGGPRRFNCFSCGRFKPRPSSVCRSCGDDPVSFNGDRREFDRAYGYG